MCVSQLVSQKLGRNSLLYKELRKYGLTRSVRDVTVFWVVIPCRI